MEELLKALGPRPAARAGDKALRAAARPIIDAAKALAPVRSGALRRSIVWKPNTSIRSQKSGERSGLIGIRRPAGSHAHLLEFGHLAVNGVHVAPRPFMRPAFDAQYNAALEALGKVLGDSIEAEAAALNKGRK